jgi:malate dehydrogenase
MDIAVVGAGGVVGRQIAVALAGSRLFPATARLQLVGRQGGSSQRFLPGLATDLADAHAEELPQIDLAYQVDEVCADIIVVALGATVGPGGAASRAELAPRNIPEVEALARHLAANGHGEELMLVLTNPVEACVAACCRHLDSRRVIGLGAYLDTMRFRQEIASDLGVRRHLVQGLVLGEHGPGMVPCWSTVSVHGFAHAEGRARLTALAGQNDPPPGQAVAELLAILDRDGPAAAYARVDRWGPALRTVVRPYITQMCGARTPVSTAETVVRLLGTLLEGGRVLAAAQVRLDGELGMRGVTGAPVVLSMAGVDQVVPFDLTDAERRAVATGLWTEP